MTYQIDVGLYESYRRRHDVVKATSLFDKCPIDVGVLSGTITNDLSTSDDLTMSVKSSTHVRRLIIIRVASRASPRHVSGLEALQTILRSVTIAKLLSCPVPGVDLQKQLTGSESKVFFVAASVVVQWLAHHDSLTFAEQCATAD